MITVYGKPDCILCKSALELLERKEIPHEYVYLVDPTLRRKFIEDYPHITKLPYILEDGKLIGGYKELHHGIFALGTIK